MPDGLFGISEQQLLQFLQHHPTPLERHRQEKTEKMRIEQEKTDGSAEPSAKTGILSLSDTYIHPQWRQFP